MASSSDFQNVSEAASYAGDDGGDYNLSSSSKRTVSSNDRPLVRLRKTAGGFARHSKGVEPSGVITMIDSSLEQANVAFAPATRISRLRRGSRLLGRGLIHRGPPSSQVQEYPCTLTEAELSQICEVYEVDLDRFSPFLSLPGQTAYDPPVGYEAVYEE